MLGWLFCFNVLCCFVFVELSSDYINFTSEPSDAVVRDGSPVNLDCVVSTTNIDGILAVNWMHNSNFLTNFDGKSFRQLSNNTLRFDSFSKKDEGSYSCSANFVNKDDKRVIGHKYSRVAKLQIAYMDSNFISFPKAVVKKDIGQTIYLSCTSPASLPLPSLFWQNNNSSLSGYQNISIIKNDSVTNTLEVSEFSYKDIGQYRCCVYNSLLKKRICSPYFELTMKIRQNSPYFVIQPANFSIAIRYSSFRLDCVVLGEPLPKVSWQRNEIDLLTNVQKNGSLYFDEIKRSDKGQYTCTGTNKEGSIRSLPSLVEVAFIDFDFMKDPEDDTVFLGNTFLLHCIPPESYPEKNDISWFKDMKVIFPDERINILKNGTLRIFSSRLSDGGNYFCEAHNILATQRRTSKVAKISIHILPSLGISDKSISIIANHSLFIDCKGNGVPFPSTILYKRINNSMLAMSKNGSYFVNNTDTDDEGHYICTSENIDGFAKKEFNVDILLKVNPLVKPSNTSLLLGKQLILLCSFSGNPIPSIQWGFLGSEGIKSTLKNSSKINIVANKLVISNLKKENEGWYYCVGNNSVNTVTLKSFVKVQVLPTIHSISKNSTVRLMKQTQLSCQVFSDPECVVSWRYKNKTIFKSSKYILHKARAIKSKLIQITYDLFIKSSTFDDIGQYTCTCQNDLSSTESSTYVDIQMIPKIETYIIKSGFYLGEQVEIKCLSFGLPLPIVYLYHNGSQIAISEKLENDRTSLVHTLKNVSSKESGVYKCLAKNSLGEDVLTKNITILYPPFSPKLRKPTILSSSSILLSWHLSFNGYSKILEIILEVASDAENRTYSISPTIKRYQIDHLHPFSVYRSRLKVRNRVGFSGYSNMVTALTLQDAPSAPLNVSYNKLGSRSLQLTWYEPLHKNGIIKLYQLSIYGNSNFSLNYTIRNKDTKINYEVDSLKPFSKYYLTIRAATSTGLLLNFGNFSSKLYFITNEENPGIIRDPLVNIIDISTVNLTWNDPLEPNGKILNYHIIFKDKQMNVLMKANTTKRYIIIDNLNPYAKYFAYVYAKNSAGKGILSSEIPISIGIFTTISPTIQSNFSMSTETLGLHHNWLSRDYLILFVGISSFALILLFAIFTTIIARCMCTHKSENKKKESPPVYLDDVGNLTASSQCPDYLVTDSPDLIFEEADSFENMIERMENDDLSSNNGYNCVEPYQGRLVPKSPLIRLNSSKRSSMKRSKLNDQKSVYEFSNCSYSPDSATEVSVVDLIDAFLENEKWYIEDGTLRRSSHNKRRPHEMML